MNTNKDQQSLDKLIAQSIETGRPEFDSDRWKKDHPDVLNCFQSRREISLQKPSVHRYRRIILYPGFGLASAALILIGIGLFLNGNKPQTLQNPETPKDVHSPAKIVSMMSLRNAYQKGGMDALDEQFQEAMDVLGPTPLTSSELRLVKRFNGS